MFAAALMVSLEETGDVAVAARFATAAAGLSVRGEGTATVSACDEIEQVLADHPEVRLR